MKKKKIRKQITSMLLAFAMFISVFGGYSIEAEAATKEFTLQSVSDNGASTLDVWKQIYKFTDGFEIWTGSINCLKERLVQERHKYTVDENSVKLQLDGNKLTFSMSYSFTCNNKEYNHSISCTYDNFSCEKTYEGGSGIHLQSVSGTATDGFDETYVQFWLFRTAGHNIAGATCTNSATCTVCGNAYTNPNNHEKPNEFTYSVNADDNTKHDKKYVCCQADAGTEKHSNYTYSKTAENIITAKCNDCGYEGSLTLSAPSTPEYNGNAQEVRLDGAIANITAPEITYTKDGATLEGKPVEVGSYTASITIDTVTASVTYEIVKGTMDVTATGYTGAYDGAGYSINVSAPDGAKVEYKYGTDGAWSETNPTFSNVGTYTVDYKVTKENYNDATGSATVTINPADMTVTANGYDGTYDKAPHSITVSAPEDAKVEYRLSENESWTTTNPTFTDPTETAVTVYYRVTKENYNDVTGSVTVNIDKITPTADMFTFTAPTNTEYDGNVKEATVSKTVNDDIGTTTIKYYDSDENPLASAPKDAGTYTVKVLVAGNQNYSEIEVGNDWTFTIEPKEVAFEWSATTDLKYTGESLVPTATATNLVDGDVCELTTSVVETTTGAGIIPSTWTAKVTGISNANYKLPETITTSFTIINATQEKPVVSSTNETIDGKNDGTISDLTAAMEYRLASDSTYTAVDSNELTNLSDGTYYVRYAAKEYYDASPDTEVIISAGSKLNVNIPETQNGYTLTVDENKVSWNGTSTLTFALKDGYSKTDSFAVKVNNETLTLDADGKYVISNIQQNQAITVEGVADITAPVAEIQLTNNTWNQFFNDITFGIFFNKTQDVTIIADNMGSGLDAIYYYLSDGELELDEVKAITDWQEYNGTFQIDPENKYVIYAMAVDKDGNTTYINSDGVVLDSIVPVISGIENDSTYYTTQKVTVTDDNLKTVTVNGNEVTDEIILEGDGDATYTIVATDEAGNSTTVTVMMKPIRELAKDTENLTHDNVTSDDAPALEELIEKLDELIADPDISDDGEKETLQQHKAIAEDLLKTIDEAAKAADTENTEKVQDVTTENVTPEDKTDLEKAKDDLEKALEDNEGNYTEDEKKAIEDEIERIDDALEIIKNVEEVESLINKIPENITKNDEATIKAAEKAYNALSDYEKSLVDKNVKKALDDAKADLEKVKKPAEKAESTSPDTGDNSNLWMWFALLFVSGGALAGINVYGRKRKDRVR